MTLPVASVTHAVVVPDTADLAAALARAAAEGATHVEIEGMEERPSQHLDALADSGLFVTCVRLGQGGSATVEERRLTLERHKREIADGARLGATVALLTPPTAATERDKSAWTFAEACVLLAAFAADRGMRLAVPTTPGTIMANVQEGLSLLPEGVGVALYAWDNERAKPALSDRFVYVRWDE